MQKDDYGEHSEGSCENAAVEELSELIADSGILGEDRAGDRAQEDRLRKILGQYDNTMRVEIAQRIGAEQDSKPSKISRFCKRFALTAAEKKVVESLCAGRSLAQHAESHFISPNTARTHLQRIREKTSISRQADIVSKALA